ncbi:C2H2 and C2HC zinc finger [Rhypophila decipiens]|uniref:C2H2 and C2HC zinc finger n=1 Tax=Rhypophila decipiens TaxID=261697 RepID=A0AAN6YE85_9PEZI|nr:C2H2 and C2HC zinc finger [Rhypophila decipiens]
MTTPDPIPSLSYYTGKRDFDAVLSAVRGGQDPFELDKSPFQIQRRWEKKSKSQRLTVLLSAWPHSMPATHRPDWATLRRFRFEGDMANLRRNLDRHRGAFLWPYINQEDLVKTRALLLLLKSRARNHPSLFAAADAAAMTLGAVRNAIEPVFPSTFVMMLNGMTSQEEYGKLFIPGEGLRVLEAQGGLLAFLLSCCHQILHDISPDKLASQEFPVEPEPAVKDKRAGTVDLLPSLLELAEEAPYRTCQDLDLKNTVSLLAPGLARAQDHIWTLREDPGYFVEQVVEDKEHRTELIKDVNGAIDPWSKTDDFWVSVIFAFLAVSVLTLEVFTDLHNQALELRALQAKHETRGEIKLGSELPSEYMTALLIFRKSLEQAADFHLGHLARMFLNSPPIRHMCVREADDPSIPRKLRFATTVISFQRIEKVDNTVLDLYSIFKVFSDEVAKSNDVMRNLGYPILADRAERHIRAEVKAKELLSPLVARAVGELSILGECMRQIDMYQPWAREFGWWVAQGRNKTLLPEAAKSLRPKLTRGIADALAPSQLKKAGIHIFGQPGGIGEYPAAKKRNKAAVEALQKAETNLDNFWAEVDKLLMTGLGPDYKNTAMSRFLAGPRTLQRTSDWIEPVNEKAKSSTTITSTSVDSVTQPLSSVFLTPTTSSDEVSTRNVILAAKAKTKVKAKSRGTPGPQASDVQETAAASQDDQPTFAVDSRALKVFRVLFFDPSSHTTPGEAAWNDFIHAMGSAGFAAQKLYGSVWHFQPTNLDAERSIQFHEPHPHGKLPFLTARRYGRRLTRAYGWVGGMFWLKPKPDVKDTA